MNENIDKLIIKIFLAFIVCGLVLLYRYAHRYFYPSSKFQLTNDFRSIDNPSDTIHLFARILGIGLLYSNLSINISSGITFAVFELCLKGILGFVVYLLSVYIVESIILYNFQYVDEIQKRQNMCYAIISFSLSISCAIILESIIGISGQQFSLFILQWLFTIVILGLGIKAYTFFTPISFNKYVIQKDLILAFSFSGYIIGIAILIKSSFSGIVVVEIFNYLSQVLLNILVSLIIFPIILLGITKIFKLEGLTKEEVTDGKKLNIGHGISEGILFLTTALITSILINKVYFGNFYPIFNILK